MTYTILKVGKKKFFYTYTVNVKHYKHAALFELKRGNYPIKEIQDNFDGNLYLKELEVVYTKGEATARVLELIEADKNSINPQKKKCVKGQHVPFKLSLSKIRKIRSLVESGLPYRKIADMFNVSHVTIVRIKTGESYSYVE